MVHIGAMTIMMRGHLGIVHLLIQGEEGLCYFLNKLSIKGNCRLVTELVSDYFASYAGFSLKKIHVSYRRKRFSLVGSKYGPRVTGRCSGCEPLDEHRFHEASLI